MWPDFCGIVALFPLSSVFSQAHVPGKHGGWTLFRRLRAAKQSPPFPRRVPLAFCPLPIGEGAFSFFAKISPVMRALFVWDLQGEWGGGRERQKSLESTTELCYYNKIRPHGVKSCFEVSTLNFPMAIFLGFLQGVAEFLPISSSGHLTLMQHFFQMEEVDNLFNILLHFATLIAVCVVYRQDIAEMIVEFFRGVATLFSGSGAREARPPVARRLVMMLIIGTLPLFVIVPFEDSVEALGNNPVFVAAMLIVTGFILFFSDRMARGSKTAANATMADALLVGVAQGVATIPGLSRSGTTISAGMLLGFERQFAVRYSFLLSLPAVLGATIIKVIKTAGAGGVDTSMLPKYLVGMVVAGIVGYFSIHLVKLLADKGKFGNFAYYCWIAGAVALAASLVMF